MPFNPTGDFEAIVDGGEAVTYVRKGAPTQSAAGMVTYPNTPSAIATALRRAVTTREVFTSNGQLRASDVVFNVPASSLPFTPESGDHVIAAGPQTFTVISHERATWGSRIRLFCRR